MAAMRQRGQRMLAVIGDPKRVFNTPGIDAALQLLGDIEESEGKDCRVSVAVSPFQPRDAVNGVLIAAIADAAFSRDAKLEYEDIVRFIDESFEALVDEFTGPLLDRFAERVKLFAGR
jgi:hypothetical protein